MESFSSYFITKNLPKGTYQVEKRVSILVILPTMVLVWPKPSYVPGTVKPVSMFAIEVPFQKEKAEIQGLHFNGREEKDKENIYLSLHFIGNVSKTTWISAQKITPEIMCFYTQFSTWIWHEKLKGEKCFSNHLLLRAVTQHGKLYIYVREMLGTQIQLQCTHQDEGFSVRKLRFGSGPKPKCSISKFDPDAAQKDGSFVIKAAIVRKSHLRCFVNPNLTFVLVGPMEK